MSSSSKKYVIGLTGNIGTGKSVVRKMLEHLGAYGIDADALGHRVISKGAPGYQPVLDNFGKRILDSDGQIDREKLGKVVFSDPKALAELEAIVHPFVGQAVEVLTKRATQKVIAIEAIKLLESPLRKVCDAIWVVDAPEKLQLSRLMEKRGMDEATARQRMDAQSPQEDKIVAADVMIYNAGSFEDTWKRVMEVWQEAFPDAEAQPEPAKAAAPAAPAAEAGFSVERARPHQAEEIAMVITRLSGGQRQMSRAKVIEAFGEKAFMLLRSKNKLVGLVGWQVENLVTRTDDVYVDASQPLEKAMKCLIEEVEAASKELQSEASLLIVESKLAQEQAVWKELGYEPRSIDGLNVRAWQEAAQEGMQEGTVLLFKQLRVDRVMRPM